MKSFEQIMEENRLAQEMADAHRSVSQDALTFRDGNQIDEAAIQKFGDGWREDVRNLPAEQQHAIEQYTYGATEDINGSLRGLVPETPETAELIRGLDEAVAAHPVPEDIMISRGTDLGHLRFDKPEDLQGQVFTENGFMSTSPGDQLPAAFQGKEAIMHLRVPAGTKALWVEEAGAFKASEQELLLARGQKWRADKVVVDAKGKIHIYGEIVP